MNTADTRLDLIFAMLVEAAIAGERCPTLEQLRATFAEKSMETPANPLPRLARMGRIKIEVYGHNFRVVEILEGEHKGKRTKKSPFVGGYKVYDASGSYRVSRNSTRDERVTSPTQEPWKPGTPRA